MSVVRLHDIKDSKDTKDEIPQYLAIPEASGHLYGVVTHTKGYYVVTAEPSVLQMVKRLFPGTKARGEALWIPDTRRAVGDLNWLLLRFPMEIQCESQYAADRERAVAHARRRDANHRIDPIAHPRGFVGELKPFQAEGVAYLKHNERCLLADDMGLGKTVQALAALAELDTWPALVVAPVQVLKQWVRMAGIFLAPAREREGLFEQPRTCHTIAGLKEGPLPPASIYLAHYGIIRGWKDTLRELAAPVVIFDEVQELRHTGTEKYSAASLVAGEARYVWALSGTPVYNMGGEIWSVLNIVDYHCLGDFDSFSREWCTGYGKRTVAKPTVLGDHLRREGLMLRRRKSEVLAQLPPKQRVVMAINHDNALYDKLVANARRLAKGYSKITDWHERGKTVREMELEARKATGVSKAPYVAEFVEGLLKAGEKVLVYAWHHEVHETLMRDLEEYGPARLTGMESSKEKEQSRLRFVNGDTDLIVLSLRTTAGLDGLQERGTVCVFAELDWSPAVHSQCEDRLHRMGLSDEKESILSYYLVADTGSDEVIQEALGLKVGQFVGLMGDAAPAPSDKDDALRAAEKHIGRLVDRLRKS